MNKVHSADQSFSVSDADNVPSNSMLPRLMVEKLLFLCKHTRLSRHLTVLRLGSVAEVRDTRGLTLPPPFFCYVALSKCARARCFRHLNGLYGLRPRHRQMHNLHFLELHNVAETRHHLESRTSSR